MRRSACERARAALAALGVRQYAVEPAIARRLHTRRRGLHEVLRIEMRACRVRRANGVNYRQLLAAVQLVERTQCRMEAKESIEIECPVALARRCCNRSGPAPLVVRLLTERHHHVEAVDCAALEDADERLLARVRRGLREQRPGQEVRWQSECEQCQRAAA